MKWIDYREKLGIGFNDEEKTKLFLAKAYLAFSEMNQLNMELSITQFNNYCFNAGIKTNLEYYSLYAENSPIVFKHLQNSTDSINNFLYYYSIFLSSSKDGTDERDSGVKAFNYWAEQAGLEFEFIEDNDNVFIFPKGAKELDDALVSEPLEWLKKYPTTRKLWIEALKLYADTNNSPTDIADKFRKALEDFFQVYFGGGKTLENYKTDYGTKLKEKGIPKEIVNNFETLLQAYTNFMNAYAKHHDKTERNVLEYIMYQTGNIIRLLIILNQEDK